MKIAGRGMSLGVPFALESGTVRHASLGFRPRSAVWRHWSIWTGAIVVLVLVGIRLALPYAIQSYLNRVLERHEKYSGQVGDVDVSLYRGAYVIHDVDIRRRGTQAPVPFVKAPLIDVSIQWAALLSGSVVGEIELDEPELNFVGGDESERQTGTEGHWWVLVGKLFPVGMNRLEVRHGHVHFRNFHSRPPVNLELQHVDLVAENLQNSARSGAPKPAGLDMRAEFTQSGEMVLRASLDPHAHAPSFDCDVVLRNVAVPDLNDFLRAYAKLDAEKGQVEVYAELAADHGDFHGYVKPFFHDVSVIGFDDKLLQENIFSTAWRAFAQGLLELFKNREQDDVATRIPISGTTKTPRGEFWPSLGNAFWNAFIQGLAPRLEHSVSR
jgi:uncharacterized protein DUF748